MLGDWACEARDGYRGVSASPPPPTSQIESTKTVSGESTAIEFLREKFGNKINCRHCKLPQAYYMNGKSRIRRA